MPLFSEHIANIYYGGSPSYSAPYSSYSSSVSPLGSSYSASYLNPGGNYSTHSSLGGYSRPPLSGRWVTSSGRNYAPLLSTISERGTASPVRIGSPRRIPITSRSYPTPSYTPRPININTADIDVSKDRYRNKIESETPPAPSMEPSLSINDNGPFMPRVDGKPETGIDSSPGLQRSTIKRGRTVVRLHTLKRKERESPRKPQGESTQEENVTNINDTDAVSKDDILQDEEEPWRWRDKLSDDLIYKDKREKKSLGDKLKEKFILKDRNEDSTSAVDKNKSKQDNLNDLPVSSLPVTYPTLNRSPDRRCSIEMLAEQANLLDSLIRGENLSTATLDLTKVGLSDEDKSNFERQPSVKRRKSSSADNPLQTTKSDHSLHETMKSFKDHKEPKQFSKRRSLKKSSSGSSICRLDSITEFPRELSAIEESRLSIKRDSEKAKSNPKIKAIITSTSVEVSESKNPLKFKVEDVTVEEKPRTPKKEISFTAIVEEPPVPNEAGAEIENNKNISESLSDTRQDSDVVSSEPDEGNFWDKIGKRETVYLRNRRQLLEDSKQKNRRAFLWFPEEDEYGRTDEVDTSNKDENNIVSRGKPISNDEIKDNPLTKVELIPKLEMNDFAQKNSDLKKLESEKDELISPVSDTIKIQEKLMYNKTNDITSEFENNSPKQPLLSSYVNTAGKNIVQIKETHKETEIKSKIKDLSKALETEPNTQENVVKPTDAENSKIESKDIHDGTKHKIQENIKPTNIIQNKIESKDVHEVHEEIKPKTQENITKPIDFIKDKTESKDVYHGMNPKIQENVTKLAIKDKTESKNHDSQDKKESKEKTEKVISKHVSLEKKSSDKIKEKPTAVKNNKVEDRNNVKAGSGEKKIVNDDKTSKVVSSKGTILEKCILEDVCKECGKIVDPVSLSNEKISESENKVKIPSSKQPRTNSDKIKITSNIPFSGYNKKSIIKKQRTNVEEEPSISKEDIFTDNKTTSEERKEVNQDKVEDSKYSIEEVNKETAPSIPIIVQSENIPIPNNDVKTEPVQEQKPEGEDKKAENVSQKAQSKDIIEQPSPVSIVKLPSPRRPVKNEPALRPLIATPRPLLKRTPQVIHSSSSSDSSSEEEDSSDDDDADESDASEDSAEFFECENNTDGRTSTGSNDSGFDSSAPTSPLNFSSIKKGGDAAGPSTGTPVQNAHADIIEQELEQSTAYDLFRKTGRFTPPARSIPRFRKYTIEDFHFVKVLGKGSFGKVLLAELRDTEYYYAVKCLKKDVVLEDDDVECTLIERKVLALGTNHPYLCHLFATFQTDSHLFFVMEYLNGGDLMFHIQQSGRFPEARARLYAAEIVSGLKFLHKRGIIYRDLKLDNILLDYEGHVRIADFGMCKLQIYLDKTADTFCGTPDYMAPEIIKGLKYNQGVDWWSFGVLLYEMLIGQSPFSGCDEDELFWSICNEMPSYPRFLSQEALTILTRLLDKDAQTRLGGAECMYGDIRDQDFFRPIHWDRLERRELEAPFKPRVRHPMDTQYFDRVFTGEKPRLTAVEPQVLRSMDQQPFRGFSYTNPNATDR
ncbi:probable serine/threonine-protein kinase DDB_G0278845 isoform X2 [Hyposmocoma kahamanoa]|uniref:probable serine/threonine-protein kinase DDB_G0278845 isoform X2 n=1 Tax=Hyposmocoma kahamanoa TaxID=1477025 RepID=UPI000E6D929E|nr:probable serine/threonine-protein kinase DDB_G0278845 isoform X2 [Hyposmocoma kahamanoa]